MTYNDDFHTQYVTAMHSYLEAHGEDSLAVGHELGRRALQERISMLDIIENHFRVIDELAKNSPVDGSAALEFLLQTLATLDIATRGFLEGTKRYEEQRARAEDLADRDEFRTALVNSLQEGFFVADNEGAVVEINSAFAELTGYGAEGLPYRWPHPWLVDRKSARFQRDRLTWESAVQYQTPIRHPDGRIVWVAVNINMVKAMDSDVAVYVGTIRDITAERAFAARESAVLRLATAVAVAKSVAEVLSITLDECRSAIDAQRVVAVIWPAGGEPTVQVAGEPATSSWRRLDPSLRKIFQEARHQLPLTVRAAVAAEAPTKSAGLVAVLSGAGDVALWLQLRVPRVVSAEDRLLVTALVGHLSLAIRQVRQLEIARETSLTLQRAMLPLVEPPAGFAVRYEPAEPPLEIGGDWYDVLPVGDHRIGIVVGDCVGRGLPAAAVMGQLRSSTRALLLTGAEPAVLLEQLDAAAALIPSAYCTTVFLATLDTESGILQYSNAGHIPAMLVGPEFGMCLLTDAGSVPLAVHRKEPRPQASQVLMPGSTLLLYTDGLVERKYESIDDGIARVADVLVDTLNLHVGAVADAVLRKLAPPHGYDDDVAMVVYQHPQASLLVEKRSTPEQLVAIRHRLAEWLQAAAIPDERASDIVLAVNEACANSIEHGYRGRKVGTVRVEVRTTGAEIHVRVSDSGSWKTPAANPGAGGRGLPLMRAVSDRVQLEHTRAGTSIEMSFRLPTTAS